MKAYVKVMVYMLSMFKCDLNVSCDLYYASITIVHEVLPKWHKNMTFKPNVVLNYDFCMAIILST